MKYNERNLKELQQLAPNTKKKAMEWYGYCIKNGIEILITDSLRTKAEQEANVKSGASKTMKSYHLVGQALDFVPVVNGKINYNAYGTAPIKLAIKEAKRLGFKWGGDWGWDKPHLEYKYKGYGSDVAVAPKLTRTLKKGMTGSDVKEIQKLLGVPSDGIFGSDTETAVKKFQHIKGLTADGIVGAKTYAKLKG